MDGRVVLPSRNHPTAGRQDPCQSVPKPARVGFLAMATDNTDTPWQAQDSRSPCRPFLAWSKKGRPGAVGGGARPRPATHYAHETRDRGGKRHSVHCDHNGCLCLVQLQSWFGPRRNRRDVPRRRPAGRSSHVGCRTTRVSLDPDIQGAQAQLRVGRRPLQLPGRQPLRPVLFVAVPFSNRRKQPAASIVNDVALGSVSLIPVPPVQKRYLPVLQQPGENGDGLQAIEGLLVPTREPEILLDARSPDLSSSLSPSPPLHEVDDCLHDGCVFLLAAQPLTARPKHAATSPLLVPQTQSFQVDFRLQHVPVWHTWRAMRIRRQGSVVIPEDIEPFENLDFGVGFLLRPLVASPTSVEQAPYPLSNIEPVPYAH